MAVVRFIVMVAGAAILASGCRPKDGEQANSGGDDPNGQVSQEVITERMPDGSIRRTTITKRTVGTQPPAPRPADPWPSDPLVRYNVERVNAYRAQGGLPPLLYDGRISAFAVAGSQRLARDHVPHANFADNAQAQHFGSRAAENQGDPRGVPVLDTADAWRNATKQVDIMLKLMMDEGPGGGHYDNIMNPKLRRIGIGNVNVANRFYLTNDFSD